MFLIDDVMRSLKVSKVFRQHVNTVNDFDFTPNGLTMVSGGADDQIIVYDSGKGKVTHKINSRKYGVELIQCTHNNATVIHSSNKTNHDTRYLSLYDNKYIHFFSGHTDKVVSLCLSPVEQAFISGSLDGSIRIWDLRHPKSIGIIKNMPRSSLVTSFDTMGKVLGVGSNSDTLLLFDVRSLDKGPFMTAKYLSQNQGEWTNLKFSSNGDTALISTRDSVIRLINTRDGTPINSFAGYLNDKGLRLEASFTPNGQYIISGSMNGYIHVWNANSGVKVCAISSGHPEPVRCVKFNPKYVMMASACKNVAYWLPSPEFM